MKKAREDRRVARTREAISTALFTLITQRGFEQLTVQDVLDQANVGRSTFYAHFEDLEDVLLQGLERLQHDLAQRQRVALEAAGPSPPSALVFSRELFAHANEHRPLFHAVVGKRSGTMIMGHFHAMLLTLVRSEVAALTATTPGRSRPPDAVAQFVAGGLTGLLTWWMRDHKARLSVDEMDAVFQRLAVPALHALLR